MGWRPRIFWRRRRRQRKAQRDRRRWRRRWSVWVRLRLRKQWRRFRLLWRGRLPNPQFLQDLHSEKGRTVSIYLYITKEVFLWESLVGKTISERVMGKCCFYFTFCPKKFGCSLVDEDHEWYHGLSLGFLFLCVHQGFITCNEKSVRNCTFYDSNLWLSYH